MLAIRTYILFPEAALYRVRVAHQSDIDAELPGRVYSSVDGGRWVSRWNAG